MSPSATRRRRLCAAALLLALAAATAAATAGCGKPPDAAWLRFQGFRASGATSGSLSLLAGKLRDGTSDAVDASFENVSLLVGKAGGGTGILVYRANVQYRMAGLAPPPAAYPLTLYIPASAASTTADAGAEASGTLSGLPLAPVTLKHWLIETRQFENPSDTPTVELFAVVTFFALTDEGETLETTGSIAVSLANSP